ncbi:hypothetical protein Zm00014a_042933 [Zea mays]|uniref:1-deoxy-D-xylulose 5-phosphate reductoisomerase chloroplastic n=2 Tax=Zea mays TaxID=4577 RepID=A0A8J8XW09_MAIZE|nr:1-deoxy-D-xylulose 5-phosphate reductoisomerase chloroplastic [Zea mays]PWZ26359.1 hypothetical protein Zm00014a_042933 [Zea mays]
MALQTPCASRNILTSAPVRHRRLHEVLGFPGRRHDRRTRPPPSLRAFATALAKRPCQGSSQLLPSALQSHQPFCGSALGAALMSLTEAPSPSPSSSSGSDDFAAFLASELELASGADSAFPGDPSSIFPDTDDEGEDEDLEELEGLEVIEAHYLFGAEYDDIEIVIHPQSIIHSMVETQLSWDGQICRYQSYTPYHGQIESIALRSPGPIWIFASMTSSNSCDSCAVQLMLLFGNDLQEFKSYFS